MFKRVLAATIAATTLIGAGLPLRTAAAPPQTRPTYEITLNDKQPIAGNSWMPGKFLAMYSGTANGNLFSGPRAGLSRPYDVDMAKMFEVTNHLCITTRAARSGINGFAWDYRIDMRQRSLGQFKISCSRARDVAKAYGESDSELTNINRLSTNRTEEYAIPTLNIVGAKVSKWMSFTQGAVRPEPPQR